MVLHRVFAIVEAGLFSDLFSDCEGFCPKVCKIVGAYTYIYIYLYTYIYICLGRVSTRSFVEQSQGWLEGLEATKFEAVAPPKTD